MCLYISKSENRWVRTRLKKSKSGYIICYKKLNKSAVPLAPSFKSKPYLVSPFWLKKYKPGWNVSNKRTNKPSKKEESRGIANAGIHVYLHKPYKPGLSFSVWVKVKCYKKDFVAAGRGEAVFTKVHLSEKEYNRAINV